jgi:hypothetical protein
MSSCAERADAPSPLAGAYLAAGARLVQVYRLYAEAGPLAVAELAGRCVPV